MEYLVIFSRTIIFYFFVLIVVRVMGKRQIGQLQPFELVVAIMIAELAVLPMENLTTPILAGILPIATIMVLEISMSLITLKSERARSIFCGRPSIVVENGKIVEKELRKTRCNINDLLELLRNKDITNIADVEFAIMETNGNLSIIPKSQRRPINPEDLGISTDYEGLSVPLIIDGNINHNNLNTIKLTEKWLRKELKKLGVKNVGDVFFASIDSAGDVYYQLKEDGN